MTRHSIAKELSLRIVSEANRRDHWRVKAARTQLHRISAQCAFDYHRNPGALIRAGVPVSGLTVTMTRIAPRRLDDDNLASGFKAVRDGVAAWLGIDDGSPLIRWVCAERKGPPKGYAAEVVVEWEEP